MPLEGRIQNQLRVSSPASQWLARSPVRLLHHPHKILEQAMRIVRLGIGLARVGRMLSCRPQQPTSAAKAATRLHPYGAPEGAPFQNPSFFGLVRLSGKSHARMPPNIPASPTVMGQNQITRQYRYVRRMATNARQWTVSRQPIAHQKVQWCHRRRDWRTVIQKSRTVYATNPIHPPLNQLFTLSVIPR